ncbi:MAG: PAS domain S-box protein [Gemmatimonadota bacterium]
MTGDPKLESDSIRVLILDDDPEDAKLIQELLERKPGFNPTTIWASKYEEGLRLLRDEKVDVCLVDYRLGARSGIDFLQEDAVIRSQVPAILMTGRYTPEVDEMALAAGAVDCLPKEELRQDTLSRAIRYAVERWRRQESGALARAIMSNVQDVITILDPQTGTVRFASPSLLRVLGYRPEERMGTDPMEDVHPGDRARIEAAFARLLATPGSQVSDRYRVRHAHGEWKVLEALAENLANTPGVAGVVISARDITGRVAQEEAVRFQASLLAAVGQAVIATDMEGRVVYWNPAAERIYGWASEEAEGRAITDLIAPQSEPEAMGEFIRTLQQDGISTGEFSLKRKDGSTFLAFSSSSLIRDGSGKPTGIIGVSSDITGLKTTEMALRERVKELRALIRTSEILNREPVPWVERLQEVVKELPGGWLHPEHTHARLTLGDVTVQSTGFQPSPWRREVAVEGRGEAGLLEVTYTGEVPAGMHTPFLPEEDEVLHSLARLVGATAQREGLQRILTQAFASIQEAVLVVDSTGGGRGVVYVNPAAERIFGYPEEELKEGSTEKLHVDHESFLRFASQGDPVLEEGGVFRAQFPMRRKDGTVFQAEQTVTLLDPSRGLDGGAVSVVADVSERTAMEEQLRQMQKMESVGQLAGGIAHDFNNILTVIGAQVELILMDLPDSATTGDLRDDLSLVQTAVNRAATLTAQLLAFSRDQILLPRVVDLGEAVGEAGKLLTRLIGEQIRIVYDFASDLPPVRVDPNRLEQVLLNLTLNARDAMPQGGTLTFSTYQEEVTPEVAAFQLGLEPGTWAVLAVADTGTGMPDDVKGRIFEPFFSTKPKGKGTGLGLAMVYGTVKQSGGSIHAESTPGQGTTFYLRFPPHIAPWEEDSGSVVQPLPDPTQPGALPHGDTAPLDPDSPPTILVIEDDAAVRRAVLKVLDRAGIQVVEAGDGETGLRLLEEGAKVDAVLSDLVLPGISGFELLDRLGELRPGIPRIAMSGYAEGSPGRRDGLPEDVAFIQKPFSLEQVLQVIRETLRRT